MWVGNTVLIPGAKTELYLVIKWMLYTGTEEVSPQSSGYKKWHSALVSNLCSLMCVQLHKRLLTFKEEMLWSFRIWGASVLTLLLEFELLVWLVLYSAGVNHGRKKGLQVAVQNYIDSKIFFFEHVIKLLIFTQIIWIFYQRIIIHVGFANLTCLLMGCDVATELFLIININFPNTWIYKSIIRLNDSLRFISFHWLEEWPFLTRS